MCLEHSVPPLNSIICSWKLVICAVKHIPKIDWKCWYTSWSIDTEPPNTIILEVVQNSVCSISILTANLVKAASWSNEFSTSFDGTNTTALIIWRCKQILDHLCSVEWVSKWVSQWVSQWVNEWVSEGLVHDFSCTLTIREFWALGGGECALLLVETFSLVETFVSECLNFN